MEVMNRILNRGQKRKAPADETVPPEEKDSLGLHLLYDGTNQISEAVHEADHGICYEDVDFVAVSGLMGGAFSTWRHTPSGKIWLKDFLPSLLPNSRIMSFGYNATVLKSRSTLLMMDRADNLLLEISNYRDSDALRSRRLIFIGHSLGGILVKKILQMAKESAQYENISQKTVGIMFMGTPHDGANIASVAAILAKIAKNFITLNDKDLKLLERDSEQLQEISRSFGYSENIQICTVLESDETTIPPTRRSVLIVPQTSARLNLGNRETSFSIENADHSGVCKFASLEDKQYQKVAKSLKKLAEVRDEQEGTSYVSRIPYDRNLDFVGRTFIIEDILAKLKPGEYHKRVALWGLGGIGKSGIAIEIAHKYKRLYQKCHIFWVRGASVGRFRESYAAIGDDLSIKGCDDSKKDILEIVKRHLTSSKIEWLLIVDNADDTSLYFPAHIDSSGKGREMLNERESQQGKVFLSSYLPQNSRGRILITSRDQQVALQLTDNQPENSFEVKQFVMEESLATIRAKLSLSNQDGDLEEFASMLGHIPLAITQACAYIEANRSMTISKYCDEFQKSPDLQRTLLGKSSYDLRRDPEIPNAILTTWFISFKQVQDQDKVAAKMMSLFGILDWQAIPKTVLSCFGADELELEEALNWLISLSLVRSESNEPYLEIHSLVGTAIYAWMIDNHKVVDYMKVAQNFLVDSFSKSFIQDSFEMPEVRALLTHAMKVLRTATQISELQAFQLLRLNELVSVALRRNMRSKDAEEFLHAAVKLSSNLFGHQSYSTLKLRSELAGSLVEVGRFGDAHTIWQKDWTYLDENATARSQCEDFWLVITEMLLTSCFVLSKRDKIQKIHAALITELSRYEGQNERKARLMNCLNKTFRHQRQFERSRDMLDESLKLLSNSDSVDTPLKCGTLRELARLHITFEDFTEASSLCNQVELLEADLSRASHSSRQYTSTLRIDIYIAQGNLDGAEQLLRKELSEGLQDLASKGDVSKTQSYYLIYLELKLSGLLDTRGNYLEAEKIAEPALAAMELHWATSPDLIWARRIVAKILYHGDRKGKARTLGWRGIHHFMEDDAPIWEDLSSDVNVDVAVLLYVYGLDGGLGLLGSFHHILAQESISETDDPEKLDEKVETLASVFEKKGNHSAGLDLRRKWQDKDAKTRLLEVLGLAAAYIQLDKKNLARGLLEGLYAKLEGCVGWSDTLRQSSALLLANTLGIDTDAGISLLKKITEPTQSGDWGSLKAKFMLAIGYQLRGDCFKAGRAFSEASSRARDEFPDDDELAVEILSNYDRFMDKHIVPDAQGILAFRMCEPDEPEEEEPAPASLPSSPATDAEVEDS